MTDPACGTANGTANGDASCITCGDVAVPLVVVAVDADDARCRDDDGREETVATTLVGPVAAGDRLLVHAGVALERLTGEPTGGGDDPVRRRVP